MNELTLGSLLAGFTLIFIALIVFIVVWIKSTRSKCAQLRDEKRALELQCIHGQDTARMLQQQIDTLERQHQTAAEQYERAIERANDATAATDRLIQSEEGRAKAELERRRILDEQRVAREFEAKEKQYEYEYESKKTELFNNFCALSSTYGETLDDIQKELSEYQAKREAINQAILREREIEERADFYRIQIKETDVKDIEVLRTIEAQLVNREVLNKLIFEVFIKRPLTEMEKRVLQGRKIGGIYKITYIKTGESYIGRSVDIGNRWKEHCLSSLNIGTIAHSTFHNVLAEKGLQNFTWEILEEVPKEKQSAREKYWIEFYHTDSQFNSKAGG